MKLFITILCGCAILFSCKKDNANTNFTSQVGSNSAEAVASLQNINTAINELGVVELPSSVSSNIRGTFKWYTKVMAPNGKPIHMLAQNNWTPEKVAYTRTILEHYLTSVPTLAYGNKTAVANNIANSNGAMTMFNDANSVSNNNSGVTGQDLQADETVDIGSPEYIDLSVRNAALEEILHFVHDLGLASTYPQFQSELESATVNAMNNQIFTPWNSLPVADYDNELLTAYNDAYWGLMEHKSSIDHPYLFLSRQATEAGDPLSSSVMHKTLPPYFTSTLFVSSSFNGTFELNKTASIPYTNQSQYYKNIKLLGSNNTNINGNNLANTFTGNKGNNILDGKDGVDSVYMSGTFAQYTLTTTGAETTITDNTPNRDGVDKLISIEKLIFTDTIISL